MKVTTQSLLKIIILILYFSMIGCSEPTPEGDKHPEIPKFPQLTNADLTLDAFQKVFRLERSDNYYYGHTKHSVFDNQQKLVIYDLDWQHIATIEHGISKLSYEDAAYSYIAEQYSTQFTGMYKRSPPHFKPVKLPFTIINRNDAPLDRRAIEAEVSRVIATYESPSESTIAYERATIINRMKDQYIQNISDHYNSNAQCISSVGKSTWLINIDQQESVARFDNSTFDKDWDNVAECIASSRLDKQMTEPKSIDKTVLSYHSRRGSRVAMGYQSLGFNYVELKLNGKTALTKVDNVDGNAGISIISQHSDFTVIQVGTQLYKLTEK